MTGLPDTQRLDAHPGWASVPGVRTLASPSFRRLVGLFLLGVGLAYLAMLFVAVSNAGAFQIDFVHAYRRASLELLAGRSPYVPEQLAAPFPANGRYGWYLYPPAFAQVLTPIALLPEGVSAALWLLLQVGMLFAAAWVGASAAGARATVDRALWTAVAIASFLPVHEVLWTGNMGGPFALSVGGLLAGGLAVRRGPAVAAPIGAAALLGGAAAGALAVFKVSPFAWLPATIRAGGGLARGGLGGVAGLLVASIALAPQPWVDYARVFQNLLAGDVRYPNNLAPAIVLLNLGLPETIVDVVRWGVIGVAVGLVVASVWLARRQGAWPAAVTAAVLATLLLPAALWYHYLVLFLPLAAFVWVRASAVVRAALLTSGALVSLGMTMPFLAAAGWLAMAATILGAVWPRRVERVRVTA